MDRRPGHSDKRNLHAVNLALVANAGLAALKTAIGVLGTAHHPLTASLPPRAGTTSS